MAKPSHPPRRKRAAATQVAAALCLLSVVGALGGTAGAARAAEWRTLDRAAGLAPELPAVDEAALAELESPHVAMLIAEGAAREKSHDHAVAAQKYCLAAREGSAEGMFRLGRLYSFGLGLKRDNAAAAAMLANAAQMGHQGAQDMLGSLSAPEGYQPECFVSADALTPPAIKVMSPEEYAHQLAGDKRKLVKAVEKMAARYNVDPRLVLAIITAESNFNPGAVSGKNAQGLMQLIPETAERFNVQDPLQPEQSLRGGIAYLRWLLAYFRGDVTLALAGYNAGEGAVDKHRGVPPYAETQAYIKRITAMYPLPSHPYDASIVGPSSVVLEREARVSALKRRM